MVWLQLDSTNLNSSISTSSSFWTRNRFTWICPSIIYYQWFKLQLFRPIFHFHWGFQIAGFNCITQWWEWSENKVLGLLLKNVLIFIACFLLQSFLWKGSFLNGWRACQYASHDCGRWDSSEERNFACFYCQPVQSVV